jgi:hypothetical protein
LKKKRKHRSIFLKDFWPGKVTAKICGALGGESSGGEGGLRACDAQTDMRCQADLMESGMAGQLLNVGSVPGRLLKVGEQQ